MTEKPTILMVKSNDISRKRFFIGHSKEPIDGGVLEAENTEILFCGTDNAADTWIGWGIVRMLVTQGKQAVMMFNKDAKVRLPNQTEEN